MSQSQGSGTQVAVGVALVAALLVATALGAGTKSGSTQAKRAALQQVGQ